jgi:hypothetical protein
MNKALLVLAFAVLTLFLVAPRPLYVPGALAASLADSQQTPREGKGCSVPKAWGQLKGVADRSVAFEDSEGSIRVLDIGPCMRGATQLIVKINRP